MGKPKNDGWQEAPQLFISGSEIEGTEFLGVFKGFETSTILDKEGKEVEVERALIEVEDDYITMVRILPNHINLMQLLQSVPVDSAVKISIVSKKPNKYGKETFIYKVLHKKVGV